MISIINGKLVIDDEEYNLDDIKKFLKTIAATKPHKVEAERYDS